MGPSPSNPVDSVMKRAPAYRSAWGQQLDTWSPLSAAATDRDLGEHVEQQREHGEVDADPLAPEPEAEVLRHGEHAAGHVHRDEAPAQEDQVEDGLDSIA